MYLLDVLDILQQVFLSETARHSFPLRKVKVKKYTLYRPWFTKGLSRSVKKKHKLYKQFLKHPSPKNEFLF